MSDARSWDLTRDVDNLFKGDIMPTKIQWCDESWNPVTGCTPAGPGCLNCYAKAMAERFWGNRKFSDIRFSEKNYYKARKWKKPRRIFVCSMGDLFHDNVPENWIDLVWSDMIILNHHTFIVLTKRPRRMLEWTSNMGNFEVWPSHIHIGVSISTQADADKLIPILLEIPAERRIISFEPALERINILEYMLKERGRENIQGVIMGCESGQGRRQFDIDWAIDMRDQCNTGGIPFFLKQAPDSSGRVIEMPELDGKVWDQLPDSEGSLL
jgi:protein gp37